MIVRFSLEAEIEVEAARTYLEQQASGLGDRLLDEVANAIEELASSPLRFSKLETLPDDQPYRCILLPTFRYAIIVEILEDETFGIAFAHASHRPELLAGKIKLNQSDRLHPRRLNENQRSNHSLRRSGGW